ncbi:Steroidogenic acute regulatory protein, mitochondrial [Bagarius yarrelli]|uniref:START domain-containing protein 1 n=1 Tax=Bagarius yarrelli TaxID=175774 RepID=A0A556VVM3_BAGYA|nr:Steroidogenic acute regulatory protein, mitochondrial [Bagarius yarrelli]
MAHDQEGNWFEVQGGDSSLAVMSHVTSGTAPTSSLYPSTFTPTDGANPGAALVSEAWKEELKDLATKVSLSAAAQSKKAEHEIREEEPVGRKTQYSSETGRIIPLTSWKTRRRDLQTANTRPGTRAPQTSQRPPGTTSLEGQELRDKWSNGLEDRWSDELEDRDWWYQQQGQDALQEALNIMQNTEDWRTEIISQSELDASPEQIYEVLFVRVEEMNEWNPNIARITVLKHIGEETMVTHEISAGKAGNLIGQRDFLSVRHSLKTERCIYLSGAATQLEAFPPQPGFIRAEDGPTCIIIERLPSCPERSKFTWLLNMDVKGWLPKSVVNQALPQAQLEFMRHLQKRLETDKKF